jgi:sec-independent protein translocase protein TatA
MGKVEGLLILLAIILLLFGAKKLPQLARGVGESMRELKKGLSIDETTAATAKKDAANSEEK